ncbi:MAG TPA: AbrB/MazE/SpoVT family DNA-binding domain-containing protein [Terriglobales bacterium]
MGKEEATLAYSRISRHGQVTVPKAVRQRLGLRAGDRVEADVNGTTVLRPVRWEKNRFEGSAGILGNFPGGIEEINAWVRNMRDDDGDGSEA